MGSRERLLHAKRHEHQAHRPRSVVAAPVGVEYKPFTGMSAVVCLTECHLEEMRVVRVRELAPDHLSGEKVYYHADVHRDVFVVELRYVADPRHVWRAALDSAAILMIQYVAFKGKTLRLGAVCNPIKERYASEARHILEEVDCSPEKRYGQGNYRS